MTDDELLGRIRRVCLCEIEPDLRESMLDSARRLDRNVSVFEVPPMGPIVVMYHRGPQPETARLLAAMHESLRDYASTPQGDA